MELIFNVIAIHNNKGFASDHESNGLFEVDVNNGECRYIGSFPGEGIVTQRLHCCAMWIKSKIFFIPEAGEYISIYDTDIREFQTINIPVFSKKDYCNYNPKLKFTTAIVYRDYMWIIPATYPGILKMNLESYDISFIDSGLTNEEYLFRNGCKVIKNVLYIASGNNNNVLLFDLDTEKGRMLQIGELNRGMIDMCSDGDDLILIPRIAGPVIRWNPKTNKVVEYNEYPDGFNPGRVVFQYIYESEAGFVLVPTYANYGIVLKQEKMTIDDKIQWKINSSNRLDFMFEYSGKMYFKEFLQDSSYRVFFIERIHNEQHPVVFYISNMDKRLKNYMSTAIKEKYPIRESSTFNLENYLATVDTKNMRS